MGGLTLNAQILVPREHRQTDSLPATPRDQSDVTEVIRCATHQIQLVLQEVNDTVKNCEAELEIGEKINVIFETDRTVFSIERSFRLVKDKP
jgi:hypothetical protein